MLSYWEREYFSDYDYVIIGSGIVGLSSAAELMENNPLAKVLVLEKGLFPSGASTKNAGFACFGTLTELLHDEAVMGTENMLGLVKSRVLGLAILRERLGDSSIDYMQLGGHELILSDRDYTIEMDNLNMLLQSLFNGDPVFSLRNDLIAKLGFSNKQVKQLIYNPFEGQINTGKMMQKLINYVSSLGVRIITGADVNEIFDGGEAGVCVKVKLDEANNLQFTCKKAILATNAFTKKFYPAMNIVPGRGQVLITKPIPNLRIKGTFNFDEGFYYFRNIGNRVLLGGGRNLAFDKETTTDFGLNEEIQQQLVSLLKTTILPGIAFEIDQQWSGIMAFGSDKLPIVELTSENIAIGVRLNGMGVALGSKIAKDLVALIA
jgi:glycine/D-amino acid oxidase-like deaminating enzyme